jgi:hypothetical protein
MGLEFRDTNLLHDLMMTISVSLASDVGFLWVKSVQRSSLP